MWPESRRFLTLMGDQRVTFAAFLGLILYGAVLAMRSDDRLGRLRAWLIFCTAALWLAAAVIGLIAGDLARWSSLAVFLFAIGVEERTKRPAQVVRPLRKFCRGSIKRIVPMSRDTTAATSGDANKTAQLPGEAMFSRALSN